MKLAKWVLPVSLLLAVAGLMTFPAARAFAEATNVMVVSPGEGDVFVSGEDVQVRVIAYMGGLEDWQGVHCVLVRPNDKILLPLLEQHGNLAVFMWKKIDIGRYGLAATVYTSGGWIDGGTTWVTVVPAPKPD